MKRDPVSVTMSDPLDHRLEPGVPVELNGRVYIVETVDKRGRLVILRPIGRARFRRWLRRLRYKARGVARAALATVTEKGG